MLLALVPTAAEVRYTESMFADDEIYGKFGDLVGADLIGLVTGSQAISWFNQGMSRMAAGVERYQAKVADITWVEGAREKALPTDFIEVDKIVTDAGYVPQAWRVYGENLFLDDSEGATQAGACRVYYWGEFSLITFDGGGQ